MADPRQEHLSAAVRATLAFSVLVPATELWRIGLFVSTPKLVIAVAATALYLPLHLRHVYYGLQSRRPSFAVLTLGLMAMVMFAAWLAVGQLWVFMFASLAVSMMCALETRVALVLVGALVLSPLLYSWSVHPNDSGYGGPYLTAALVFRSVSLFTVVWLVGATGRLRAVQTALAAAAVQEERAQLREELRHGLGERLAGVAALAAQAQEQGAVRDPATSHTVAELIDGSRATLSEVTRIVDSYQRVSARPELEAAAQLLTGAGIDAGMIRAARERNGLVLPAQVGSPPP